MSLGNFFKDIIKQPFELPKKIIGGFLGDNDDARKLINKQMEEYKKQTELTRSELERTRGEAAAEKRKIQEKQIRSLRRNYRPSGLLGVGESATPDMSQQLGA